MLPHLHWLVVYLLLKQCEYSVYACMSGWSMLNARKLITEPMNKLSKAAADNLDHHIRYYPYIQPEAFMTTCEIIRYHNYTCEEYDITTADGYIITIHRIPYGKKGPGQQPRSPVLIQHGLFCSSSSWVLNIGEQNLPNYLADRGYDAWISNVRGNSYGLRHKFLTPDDRLFWKFSFHEMAMFDTTAIIDFILKKTGFDQLYYAGHSMGTAIPLALLSTKPQYNKKIKAFIAMGPAASFKYTRTPAKSFLINPVVRNMLRMMAPGEAIPTIMQSMAKFTSTLVCSSPLQNICTNFVFWIVGPNIDQLNMSRVALALHHVPDRTSIQTFLHIDQHFQDNYPFSMYDYGYYENLDHYGQPKPPAYNLSNVVVPVMIMWGPNDLLTDGKDAQELARRLKQLSYIVRVPDDNFHHGDFMMGLNAKKVVYSTLMNYMRKIGGRSLFQPDDDDDDKAARSLFINSLDMPISSAIETTKNQPHSKTTLSSQSVKRESPKSSCNCNKTTEGTVRPNVKTSNEPIETTQPTFFDTMKTKNSGKVVKELVATTEPVGQNKEIATSIKINNPLTDTSISENLPAQTSTAGKSASSSSIEDIGKTNVYEVTTFNVQNVTGRPTKNLKPLPEKDNHASIFNSDPFNNDENTTMKRNRSAVIANPCEKHAIMLVPETTKEKNDTALSTKDIEDLFNDIPKSVQENMDKALHQRTVNI